VKKIVAFCLIFSFALCLFGLTAFAEEVVFSGNFEPITFSVGLGSKEKLTNGITAIDPHTKEDITERVEILGTIDFDTVGVYNVSYSVVDSTGKNWGKLRKVSVVALDSDVEYINIDHGKNYLESIDFQMIKNTDFELHYLLYANNYEKLLYSWCFTGEDIYNPPRRMSVTITGESENYEAIKNGVGQANFQILNFEYKDRFPSKAEIFFSVNEEFDINNSLYLYSYGEPEGFKLIDDGIVINSVYYASCFFEKGGEYVLTDKKIGYSNSNIPHFTSSADHTSSKTGDSTQSEIHINPEFNEDTSYEAQPEQVFSDLEKNIYLLVVLSGVAIIVISAFVVLISSRKSR